jgi:CPA1 family monovalent cation:H+ antiporter
LVPALRETHLPPEAVLLLFLPILLYWESFTSSWREIRGNARVVVLLSTVLVVLTAALVAVAAHALGMMWGPAWVLGAAVAPTDATAVSVLGRVLPAGSPRPCARRAWSTTGQRWSSTASRSPSPPRARS